MENQTYIDELDFKSALKIIIKRKVLILIISLMSVIILATPALFEPKIYLATASITITPQNITHKIRLKSNLILTRIIQKLNLRNPSGKELSADELSEKLTTKNAGAENLTYLEVTADNPEKAKEIANTWVQEYLKYIQELNSQHINLVQDTASKQLEIARKNLQQAEENALNFRKTHKLVLMQTELLTKEKALDQIKKKLDQIEFDVKLKEITVTELKNQIATKNKQTPLYQDLEKRIVDNTTEINTFPIKTDYLKKMIQTMTEETLELDNELLQKEYELKILTHEVDIRQNEYRTLSERVNRERDDLAFLLGDVKILSTAISPTHSVNHGKLKKILSWASILGLILGIFIAFCIEFWQKGKKENI